jgi:hypothetical protein
MFPRPRSVASLLILFLAALSVLGLPKAGQTGEDPAVVGQWSPVLSWPIVAIHAHLLPNKKVLAWQRDGGSDPRVWDPATNVFTSVPLPRTNLFCSGHAFLQDGRLAVFGGHIENSVGKVDTNVFDYRTSAWSPGPDMNAGRWYPSALPLPNGEVAVLAGNVDETYGANPLPQVRKSNGILRSLTGALSLLPLYPMLHLAPNGKLFLAGPARDSFYMDTAGEGRWKWVAVTTFPGFREAGSSVMHDPGKVVLIGGYDPPTRSCEVIDLNDPAPAWKPTAPMAYPRRQANATLLADGTVLVTGGTSSPGFNDATGAVYAAEIWDPATGLWSTVASAAERRLYHSTAILLADGRVLSAGGGQPAGANGDADHYTAEIYSPPYLFKGPRPTLSTAPSSVSYGESFPVATPDADDIARVHLIALGSTTHSQNQNQRINRLTFTPGDGGLSVTAPANSALCPPGCYMLFLVNSAGAPSVSRMIKIPGTLPPAAPSGLTATPLSSSAVRLDWIDNSNNETGFRIERSLDGVHFDPPVAAGKDAVTWTGTRLAAATKYYYRVRAYNGAGESAHTAAAAAATPEVGSGTGLTGEYYDAMDFTDLKTARLDPRVNFDWGTGSPDAALSQDGFSVRWSGFIKPRHTETHTFYATSDDGVRLWVNGVQVIDSWSARGPTVNSGALDLAAGVKYPIVLEYCENVGRSVARLEWKSASQAREVVPMSQLYPAGLRAAYYDNIDFTGRNVRRMEGAIDYDWGPGTPDARIAPDTFSARYTGHLTPRYTETYTFSALTDDGIRVWIDGRLVIDNWADHPLTESSATIALTASHPHTLKIQYYESTGSAVLKLFWSSPSQAKEIIPASCLFPGGTSVR